MEYFFLHNVRDYRGDMKQIKNHTVKMWFCWWVVFILKLNFFYFFSFHKVHGFLLSLISDVYQIKLLRKVMN